jgi:hypothetical protein
MSNVPSGICVRIVTTTRGQKPLAAWFYKPDGWLSRVVTCNDRMSYAFWTIPTLATAGRLTHVG